MPDHERPPPQSLPPVRWETGVGPFRSFSEWTEDPWAPAEDKRRRRIERHRRWIASLSDRDWARLAALADRVTENYTPARLDDLDAPIAVGVCSVDEASRLNGERFGVLKGRALLAWPKGR